LLEEIEEYLHEGWTTNVIDLVGKLEKEQNVFLALRMILKSMAETLGEAEKHGEISEEERHKTKEILKDLIPIINGISNRRYRAILLSELAVLFYKLDDDLNGDIGLKTAMNLVSDEPDVVRDILMELLREDLLKKASRALKMIKDTRGFDVVLTRVAENLYLGGKPEKALAVAEYISNPFHRALTFYYLATIEGKRNLKRALEFIERALKEAEMIDNPDARFELILKIYDLKHALLGESLNVGDVLSKMKPHLE